MIATAYVEELGLLPNIIKETQELEAELNAKGKEHGTEWARRYATRGQRKRLIRESAWLLETVHSTDPYTRADLAVHRVIIADLYAEADLESDSFWEFVGAEHGDTDEPAYLDGFINGVINS